MEAIKVQGMNRDLQPPPDWNPETQGECVPLPVFAEVQNGNLLMTSAWQPNEDELEALRRGQPVALTIYGQYHPPLAVGVFEPAPESDDEKRLRLEAQLWMAVNELAAHMGSNAFMIPGRINPQFRVYVGDPDRVLDLVSGVAFKGKGDGGVHAG